MDIDRKRSKFSMDVLTKMTIDKIKERGVTLDQISEIVYFLQKDYVKDLSMEACRYSVLRVLSKREVVHAILTGIALDELAEKDLLPDPILTIIKDDESLFGIDEIIPLSIVNLYGSIGLTNYGYLDKKKIGIIKKLDEEKGDKVNTFLDDLLSAVARAAASRIAHSAQ